MNELREATDRAGALLHTHIGLRLEPWMVGRLTRAVREAAAASGMTPAAFVTSLRGDPDSLQLLCDQVTVQESGFFRHPEQFEVLARDILPTLEPPIRIWSAASANGQEPYSLAMTLLETGTAGRVMATDVSAAAIRRTELGRYTLREAAGLSPARRAAFGTSDAKAWAVNSNVKALVDAGVWNLTRSVPAAAADCQVVFCRNVLIYFTPAHTAAFLDRLAATLPRGARLFLGGAESLWHVSERFEPERLGDAFVYRVREDSPSPARRGGQRLAARPNRPKPAARQEPAGTRPARPRPATPAASATADTAELARLGHEAHLAGDNTTAVRMYRQWTYLQPDDALAHFHLGLALESCSDAAAASRAFAVTRKLLQRPDGAAHLAAFGGYSLGDVLRLLDQKQEALR